MVQNSTFVQSKVNAGVIKLALISDVHCLITEPLSQMYILLQQNHMRHIVANLFLYFYPFRCNFSGCLSGCLATQLNFFMRRTSLIFFCIYIENIFSTSMFVP